MRSPTVVIAVVLLWANTIATASPSHQEPAVGIASTRTDLSLVDFLLRKQALAITQNTDPVTSQYCFSVYLPQLQDASNQWSKDYTGCVMNAAEERASVKQQMKQQQHRISQDASGVCSYIGSCQVKDDAMEFFNCFGALSENVLGTVYSVSNNASDMAVNTLEELNAIDSSMYKCTNNSERAYVDQTSAVYSALDNCLQHGPPPSPPSTTTTTSAAEAQDELNIGMQSPSNENEDKMSSVFNEFFLNRSKNQRRF